MQSMLTCDTMDTAACVQQTLDLVAVGCQLVRITAPTVKDAANLKTIVAELRSRDCHVPIVADIHFKPDAALEAARWVEKVRINPGNYADSKKFAIKEYTDEQYAAELSRIEERFTPLVKLCKELGRALRIGTNHGSLSDRIMNRYGDTPLGMVESALEFARIARNHEGKVRLPIMLVATVKRSPWGPTKNEQSVAPNTAGSAPISSSERSTCARSLTAIKVAAIATSTYCPRPLF
jgi:(E)-4-hydroxy-3-methylbut-2-enyl-diphosphate synthase